MYLIDVALLWRWLRFDGRCGQLIRTWDEFKEVFCQQFFPKYAENKARARIHRYKRKVELRDYVQEFSKLMLQIPSLPVGEAFF